MVKNVSIHKKGVCTCVLMVATLGCWTAGEASGFDAIQWNEVIDRADSGCLKECLKSVAPDVMEFQEKLLSCVRECPSIEKSALAPTSRNLGIAAGGIGFFRLIPWMFRLCRDVPLCVVWARDPGVARCWGTTATIVNTVLACVSFSSTFVFGESVNALKCVSSTGTMLLSLAQFIFDCSDWCRYYMSNTLKKRELERVLDKMVDSFKRNEMIMQNNENVTWEIFYSFRFEVDKLLEDNESSEKKFLTEGEKNNFRRGISDILIDIQEWERQNHV